MCVQVHQVKLQEALAAADAKLGANAAEVFRVEAAMRRTNTDIERKTRELEALNWRLAKMTAANPQDEDLGAIACPHGSWLCIHVKRAVPQK